MKIADETRQALMRAVTEGLRPMAVEPQPSPLGDADAPDDNAYHAWRVRRERAAALAAELDLRLQAGTLCRAGDVQAALARRVAAARDVLLGVADRLAVEVAHETDVRAVHQLLTAEMHRALILLAGAEGAA